MMNPLFQELKSLLDSFKQSRIVIATHEDPDLDAIGSSLAFHFQLQKHGFNSMVWSADISNKFFHFLPKYSCIKKYLPHDYDILITLDASSLERIKKYEELKTKDDLIALINIDHHQDNTQFGSLNIYQHISSVGELSFLIFDAFGWELDSDIATCLYAAISFDTGRFQHNTVTAQSLDIASKLVSIGANPCHIASHIYDTYTLDTLSVINSSLNHLVTDFQYRFAYTILEDPSSRCGPEVMDLIRKLAGIDIFLVIRQYDSHMVKISLRSKTDFNVAQFAAQFGGGGHNKAAGITMEGHVQDVESIIIKSLKDKIK
ncbi:MAG: DHH family phosphoesterase [Candidatus Margulisbacteria bacterium]|nr:DHH family phosphoesterase [Candidatus Margulisiibacteriota bacterium]